MGYFTNKDVAEVNEPHRLTLANNPNFVVFDLKQNRDTSQAKVVFLEIGQTSFVPYFSPETQEQTLKENAVLVIDKPGKERIVFTGTYDKRKVNDNTFYVARAGEKYFADAVLTEQQAQAITAENLRACLNKDSFFRNNCEVTIQPKETNGEDLVLEESNTIVITAKGIGEKFRFNVIRFWESSYPHIIRIKDVDYNSNLQGHVHIDIDLIDRMTGQITSIHFQGFSDDPLYGFELVRPVEGKISDREAKQATLYNLAKVLNDHPEVSEVYYAEYLDSIPAIILHNTQGRYNFNNVAILGQGTMFFDIQGYDKFEEDFVSDQNLAYQIELDIYDDLDVFLGGKFDYTGGKYLTVLSKSYFGEPLWFNLNSLMSKQAKYSTKILEDPNPSKPWVDAGTMSNYRFEARLFDGTSRRMFYLSDVLYVLNGYNYTLGSSNLEGFDELDNSYVFDFDQNFANSRLKIVKPLTTRNSRTHIMGQTHYFNFLLKDDCHNLKLRPFPEPIYPHIGLRYKMYTQSGQFIGDYLDQVQEGQKCAIVNTTQLSLDKFLPSFTNDSGLTYTVGRIDVYLCRWHRDDSSGKNEPEVLVSTPLSFTVLPQHLHQVKDFAFINRLGGWDTMNFGGASSSEFKTTAATIFKTLQPGFNLSSEIEKVNYKSTQEQFVVQTSPITSDIVQWLREMSASPAVYELSTRRYVVIDDMTLKCNSKDDLFQVEIKYHYTDTFNAR